MLNAENVEQYIKNQGGLVDHNKFKLKEKDGKVFYALWKYDFPKPTDDDLAQAKAVVDGIERKQEIYTRLGEIDRKSIRPLRAKLNGTNTQADDAELAKLETEAQSLRDELETL